MKFHKILISLIFIMFLVGITCVSAENIDELGTSSSDDVISTDGDVSNTIDNVESDVSTDSVDDERISDIEPTRGNTYVILLHQQAVLIKLV